MSAAATALASPIVKRHPAVRATRRPRAWVWWWLAGSAVFHPGGGLAYAWLYEDATLPA